MFVRLLLIMMLLSIDRKLCNALRSVFVSKYASQFSASTNRYYVLHANRRKSEGNDRNKNDFMKQKKALKEINSLRTGRTVEIHWNDVNENQEDYNILRPIDYKSEKEIIPSLVVSGEYLSAESLSPSRQEEIMSICQRTGIDIRQAMSLRKQLLVEKVRNNNHSRRFHRAKKDYKNGIDIITISKKYDIPAVAIIRKIIFNRIDENYPELKYKEKKKLVTLGLRYANIKNIQIMLLYSNGDFNVEDYEEIREEMILYNNCMVINPFYLIKKYPLLGQILCNKKFWEEIINYSYDVEQLLLAKSIDHVSYNSDYLEEREQSLYWEESLYQYLNDQGINYLNEKQLQSLGCKVTPDVILLDDCYINHQLIKWIDCKSYYGTKQSLSFYTSLKKQVIRYNQNFNHQDGAVIFRLSHSIELASKSNDIGTLILGEGPLHCYNKLI